MTRTERFLRLLTYGALLLEVHALLKEWADRRMDAELKRMCELGVRP